MEISQLISLQREFDESHVSSFPWAQSITADDSTALTHISLSLAGEVGEIANLVKKYDRGDIDYDHLMKLLPGEIADVFIYVMKMCYQAGIDLESSFVEKLELNKIRFMRAEK